MRDIPGRDGATSKSLGVDWCSRRVLYPAMLASMLNLTGWSSHGVLLLQGAITALCIYIFSLTISKLFSVLVAATAAALLSVYAWEFVIGLFMTEVPGFALGLLGLSLLLTFSESSRVSALFLGCALLSLAMTARAGAVLVLPAVVLWTLTAGEKNSASSKVTSALIASTGIRKTDHSSASSVVTWRKSFDPRRQLFCIPLWSFNGFSRLDRSVSTF